MPRNENLVFPKLRVPILWPGKSYKSICESVIFVNISVLESMKESLIYVYVILNAKNNRKYVILELLWSYKNSVSVLDPSTYN